MSKRRRGVLFEFVLKKLRAAKGTKIRRFSYRLLVIGYQAFRLELGSKGAFLLPYRYGLSVIWFGLGEWMLFTSLFLA